MSSTPFGIIDKAMVYAWKQYINKYNNYKIVQKKFDELFPDNEDNFDKTFKKLDTLKKVDENVVRKLYAATDK